jgi:hypothetical protein
VSPRFPIALVLLIVLVAAISGCGGDGGSEDPQTVIDEATLQGIESGEIDLTLAIDAKGKEGGDLDLSLAGAFEEGSSQGDLPQLDLIAKADGSIDGERIDFDGGLVLLPSSAYVNYQGVDYEVDPTTYSFVESIVASPSPEGESTSLTGCQETIGELKPADFADKLKDGGEADVGGTSTTKVSGELDVTSAIDSLIELTKDPACEGQLNTVAALPSTAELEEARGEVKGGVKSARVDVYVGDDDIVRRISAQLQLEPQKKTGKGPSSADVDFDLQLTGVNDDQEIGAPEGAKPLSDLFLKLGINPLELLGLLQGEGDPQELLERIGGAGG